MATRRRSLEERNLKTLRELAALPANKQCFDCHQRGPTYINMTIGSFVCTSCSGILRGLTPPHRVKSITMTTFTPDEIDCLKSRGNEYCRYVWLGTYDSRTSNVDSDIKDEHRKRDLMSQKYEKKRWYVDPDIAIKKMQHDQQFQPKPSVQQPTTTTRPYARVPDVQPLSQLLGKAPASIVVENYQNNEKWPNPVSSASASSVMTTRNTTHNHNTHNLNVKRFELFAEFTADTFVSPSSSSSSTQGSTANGNFANFDSAFVNSDKPEVTPTSSSQFFSNNNRISHTPPVGWTSFDDDLDPLSPTRSSAGQSQFSSSSSFVASRGSQPSSSIMPRPLSLPTFAPTNPFKSFPAANPLPKVTSPTQWPSFPVSSSNAGMPASVSLDAYPSLSTAAKEGGLFNPTVGAASSKTHQQPPPPQQQQQNSQQDRYAALADLDIHFNQPISVTSPTWSMETTTTAMASPITTSAHFPGAEQVNNNNVFTIGPSNPFASSSSSWGTLTSAKVSNAPAVNPFQNANDSSCLPYQPQSHLSQAFSPLPVVGNSPSDDIIRAQYGANPTSGSIPFGSFNTSDVSNPPNGYHGGSFFVQQNGEFATSPTGRVNWGVHTSASMPLAFPANQLPPSVPPPAPTSAAIEKCPNQFSQYSEWMPNPANPFAVGSGIGLPAPKPTSNNPFL